MIRRSLLSFAIFLFINVWLLAGCTPVTFECSWDAGEMISDQTSSAWTVVLDVLDLDCE